MATDGALEEIVGQLFPGGKIRLSWPLTGGVSAAITAVEVQQSDGNLRRITVREPGVLDAEPPRETPEKEFQVIEFLHAAGFPVPAPLHLDLSGEIIPGPFLVLEHVDGRAGEGPGDLNQHLKAYAETLAWIHQFPGSHPSLSFLPHQEESDAERLATPPDLLNGGWSEEPIRGALAQHWPPKRRNNASLLHGDLWSGNMVWRDGRLAAVIDWEDAAVGDPLADLAVTRLEVLWAHGAAAMRTVTELYQAQTGIDVSDLAIWDLCAALRPIPIISGWGLSPEEHAAHRAGHLAFVTEALERLAAEA